VRNKIESGFQTDSDKVFVVKLWLPLILLIGMGAMLRGTHHALVLALPVVLWASFNLSAAQVRVDDQHLRYRRFLRWKRIPYEEIRECKVAWAPSMGCIKLRRFVPPWGKIYFVLEGPFEWAIPGGQTKLTAYINARAEGKQPADMVGSAHDGGGAGVVLCVVMVFAGVLFSLLAAVLFPSPPQHARGGGFPARIAHIEEQMFEWPWNLVVGSLLAAWILRSRFRDRAWILAFGLGGLLGSVVARALQ